MVNDNVIDLVGKPGAKVGELAILESIPATGYIRFVNHLVTGATDSKLTLDDPVITTNSDGTVTATLSGRIPLGKPPQAASIAVPSPTIFAETVLREALSAKESAPRSRSQAQKGTSRL